MLSRAIAYALSKVWLLALPLVWRLRVDRQPLSLSPMQRGGLGVGMGLGLLISAGIPMGLGDVNGDTRTDQIAGDLILIDRPTVNLLAGSNQAVVEGDTWKPLAVCRRTGAGNSLTAVGHYSARATQRADGQQRTGGHEGKRRPLDTGSQVDWRS